MQQAQLIGSANIREKVTYRHAVLLEDEHTVSLVIFPGCTTLTQAALELLQLAHAGSTVLIDGYYGNDNVSGTRNFIVTKARAALPTTELTDQLLEQVEALQDALDEIRELLGL